MDETDVQTEPEFLLEAVAQVTVHLTSGAVLDLAVLPEDTFTVADGGIRLNKAPVMGPHGPITSLTVIHQAHIAGYQWQETVQRRRNPKFNKPQTSEAGAPTAVMGKAPEFTGPLTVR